MPDISPDGKTIVISELDRHGEYAIHIRFG